MYRARYRRIVLFFARILLSFAFWDLFLPRIGLGMAARRSRPERMRRSAVAFRILAIHLGGVMIKVGQFLSTRVDLLPSEITTELAGLQDEVPPVPFHLIRKAAEKEYGTTLEEHFSEFDPTPLAAASLGQVHRAKLCASASGSHDPDCMAVVVKIQRPDIEEIITTDLAALNTVGSWLRRYRPISRRADVLALLAEFSRILYQEVDYLAEGRNAETFAANFANDPAVRVPSVSWPHTTRRVLTLEDVWGIKITDYQAIETAGIDRNAVAVKLMETYFRQIFEDGFFHADPHPGNLFISVTDPDQVAAGLPPWRLTFVDFGMVGNISSQLRSGLRETLIAVGTQDAARVVRSYQTLGVLLPSADLKLLEKAEERIFERFWGKDMSELRQISMEEIRQFADEFKELLYSMPFQVPHNLIFLARAVSILSGICTGLDERFNLWEHLAPYARQLIADDAQANPDAWFGEIEQLVRSLVSVPRKMDGILNKLERGDLAVQAPEVTRQVNRLQSTLRQLTGAVIFTGLLSGGIQLYLAGQTEPARLLLGAAGITLLWIWFTGRNRNT